jgi:hypothetical protein
MTAHSAIASQKPAGEFTRVEGEEYYRITGLQALPPFLMTLASDTDLWMFVSSTGGLTAGRVSPEACLFPYETADKLHDAHHHTGPVTVLRVRRPGSASVVWQPFTAPAGVRGRCERSLYKNTVGNRLLFEEVLPDLELAFRYRWAMSEEFGLVRTATLENRGRTPVAIELVDGLRNIMPYGVPLALQQQSSCLVDAYKQAECDAETHLGIFALTAEIVDRAEPAEQLRANTVWCHGLQDCTVSLSLAALDAIVRGEPVRPEHLLTGRRGNYLVATQFELDAGARQVWHLVADVGRSQVQVTALRRLLREESKLGAQIEASLERASEGLRRIVASADGIQLTGHPEAEVHHFANVLFNTMRGGVLARNYSLPGADFAAFLAVRNRKVADRQQEFLAQLPEELSMAELVKAAREAADPDLRRLCLEYLPLYFGRRHGDPSRPWNRFAIHVHKPDGSRALHYEGNWRDIFQNWEALSLSFPALLPNLIAKFVNASTVDGFNPYRLTREGVDWEVADPDDPWSYIGYWGDHQVVYLLKILEAHVRFFPGELAQLLEQEIFSYADVPYRLAPYESIVANPRATIVYDTEGAARIAARVQALGTDGKLLPGLRGTVYHVNLLEKLLVPALSKLSNFVPLAGIWMNTQRPEWNDANNALAGNGVSTVTLCYLRRYLAFLEELLQELDGARTTISSEVVTWLRAVHASLAEERARLDAGPLEDADRRRLLDALGKSFSEYRAAVYARGFSGKQRLAVADIVTLCREARGCIDHALRASQRDDGLYHAYQILELGPEGTTLSVRPLYEMLEGQVAALSSGAVGAREANRLLAALFASPLYRQDQRSFMLYPARRLPGFLAKNVIPEPRVAAVPLLVNLLRTGDTSVVERDADGVCRFHADFRNALDLGTTLDRLAARPEWALQVERDRQAVLDLFEAVFDHRAFTGRSGTMYAYEGLGSIYWHMVAKLLLAVQEVASQAIRDGQPADVVDALVAGYYRIQSGLGFEKTVAEYGAFPTDPYSHTPAHGGAQQPGMTGQVKEEILTRFGELGVQVEAGVVRFSPRSLRRSEFRPQAGSFRFYGVDGEPRALEVPAGALAFTFCQVPVVYHAGEAATWVRVTESGGAPRRLPGDRLDAAHSRSLFERCGTITRIDVGLTEAALWPAKPGAASALPQREKSPGIASS